MMMMMMMMMMMIKIVNTCMRIYREFARVLMRRCYDAAPQQLGGGGGGDWGLTEDHARRLLPQVS